MRSEVDYLGEDATAALTLLREAEQRGELDEAELQRESSFSRRQLESLARHEGMLIFPSSVQFGLQTFSTAGGLMIIMAAALAFSSEFAWGTHRILVAGGRSRTRIILMQLLGILCCALATMLLAAGVSAVIGAIGRPGAIPRPGAAGAALAAFGPAMLAVGLWVSLGMAAALLTRSPGSAVSVAALAWAWGAVGTLFVPAAAGWNIDSSLAALLLPGSSPLIHGLFHPAGLDTAILPSRIAAAAGLGGLTLVATLVSVWRFRRMEIA